MSEARHSARPAPHTGTVDGRDDGLRQIADRLGECGHRLLKAQPVDGGGVGVEHAGAEVAHVEPGAEAAARAREDHRVHVWSAASAANVSTSSACITSLIGVEPLGPVEPQHGDAVARSVSRSRVSGTVTPVR